MSERFSRRWVCLGDLLSTESASLKKNTEQAFC
jgi:hypothetical protein